MQDIRETELRDSGSNANTKICFEVRATQKDLHYVHAGPSTKGPPMRNYNSTLELHNSSLKQKTSTQEVGSKPSTKQKKYIW